MLCTPEEVMASETAYLAALQRYQSSSIVDGRLVIVGDGVELVYDPA
jgi:heat shock protein HslJ